MIEQSVSLASNGVVKVPGYEQLVRFGYTKNRGVYRLHVDATGEWEGLTIRAFWHVPDGKDPPSSLVKGGSVDVPASVTAQPGSGVITFEGSDGAKVMTSADLRYRVSANSGTEDGTEPEPDTPAWQQLVDAVHTDATAAEQAKVDAQEAAKQAGASAKKAGQALSDTITAKEDALKAIGDKQTTATQAVDTARDKALQQVEASTEAAQTAASEAATSAGNANRSAEEAAGSLRELKDGIANGEFKGEPGNDGKSPVVTVTDIENGHRVSITDKDGTKTIDVLNGQTGKTGATPVLTIGTVSSGDKPSADITGTPENPVLNLRLQPGPQGPAVALDTTLTHEGEAADAKVTGDKISGLKEDVGDLSSNINAIRFMSESTKRFCTCCASFGKYLYIFYNNGSGSFCDKYDVSIDYSPTLANTLKLTDERLACSDAKIENGYLYVTLRDGQGGTNTTEGKTLGELHIISLNSFQNVKTLTMDWKCTALTIHKDYLVISMQLAGYDLYDLTNPTEPTLTYSFRPEIGSVEYQECAFFERDNKTYFIAAGFGFGFYIWDVTSKTLPIRVGTFMFSQAWNNGDNLHLHTESIVIDGNIAYATLSVSEKYIDTEYDKRGIIKFDISNLDVYKYERMNEIPYEQILINKTDYSPFYGDYDVKPTRLVKVGNALVTNSGAKGLACFKIEDNSVKYNGLIPVSDTSIIDRIYATSDGRIFGVNVYNTKLSGKDMIMIRLVNVKF